MVRTGRGPADENPYRGVKRFLIFASGAHPQLLRTAQFEESTFVGLGGTVVATAVMATVSMAFAMHIALRAMWPLAILIGLLWGLLIFNIDRWILTSSRRMRSTAAQIAVALPRLLVAVLIGLVIAEPLMLQAFKPEISQQIEIDRQDRINEAAKIRTDGPKAREIADNKKEIERLESAGGAVPADEATLQKQIDKLKGELADAESAVSEAEARLQREVEGLSRSGRSGCGPACRVKTADLERAQRLLSAAHTRNDGQIAGLTDQLNRLRADRQEQSRVKETSDQDRVKVLLERNGELQRQIDQEYGRVTQDRGDGLVSAVVAFEHLRDNNPSVKHIHLVVLLLLVAVDILPALGKLLQTFGDKRPYERLQDAVDARVAAYAKQVTDEAQHQSTQWKSLLELDEQARQQAERENVEGFVREAAAIQRRLGSVILNRWEAEQARLLGEQPRPHDSAGSAAERDQTGGPQDTADDGGRATSPPAPESSAQPNGGSDTSATAPAGWQHTVDLNNRTATFVPPQPSDEPTASSNGHVPPTGSVNGHHL